MAKKTRTVYRYAKKKFHSSRGKMTPQRILKWTIALAPVTAYAVSSYQKGGGGVNGLVAGINSISSSYSGYDITTGKVQLQNLAIGYVPLFFAWVFGKVSSRVLR
jgi:hypothetical protein